MRTFLALFTVCGTSFLVYAPLQGDIYHCRRTKQGQITESVEGNREEDEENHEDDIKGYLPHASTEASSEKQKQQLEQIGQDVHVGVFFFYDVLLFILGITLPDAACLVMWQPIFMWLASLIDAILRRWQIKNMAERTRENHVTPSFTRWITKAFVSVFPAMLLLPAGMYIFINVFGYFMDDLGLW